MIPQLKPLTAAISGMQESYNNMRQHSELTMARRELAKIFKYEQEALCEEDSAPSMQALRLLLAYPQLAKEWYEADPAVPYRFSPLSIFVASGAGLRAVEAVDQLYKPAVATKHPELKFYPLHAACEVHSDVDVIEYLANRYPPAVQQRDSKGDLLIHSILSQGKDAIPRRKTIEHLLELYPESLQEKNSEGACPLGVAFQAGQSKKVIERIIEARLEQDIHSLDIVDGNDFELGVKEVKRLAVDLLPQLKLTSLRCEPASYTDEGFVHLMECLQRDHSIETLSLAFPPIDGCAKGKAFLEFFKNNITMRHLTLTRRANMWSFGSGMDYLLEALGKIVALQSLHLSGAFMLSGFELGFLIAMAPMKLMLNQTMLSSKLSKSHSKQWGTSLVTDLTLRNCKMRGKCLDKLLEGLKFLPALKRLTLDFTMPEDNHDEKHLKGRDVTKQILSVLKHGKLESLKVQGLSLDVSKLSSKLRKNRTLKVLHIDVIRSELSFVGGCLVSALLEENRCLEEVKFHTDYNYDHIGYAVDGSQVPVPTFTYVDDPAIKFYTARNRCGKRHRDTDKSQSPPRSSNRFLGEKPDSLKGGSGICNAFTY